MSHAHDVLKLQILQLLAIPQNKYRCKNIVEGSKACSVSTPRADIHVVISHGCDILKFTLLDALLTLYQREARIVLISPFKVTLEPKMFVLNQCFKT